MKVFWKDAEKTILVREFSGEWTLAEYDAAIVEMRQMLDEVQHDVYLIIDATAIQSVPMGAMSHLNEGHRNLPPHLKMRILVTQNSLVTMLFTILQRIAPDNFRNFHSVSSLESAYRKIAQAQISQPLD